MKETLILLAIPFFLVFIFAEWWYAQKSGKNWYHLPDSLTNLHIGIGQQSFNLFFKFILVGVYVWMYEHFAIWQIPQTWWSFIIATLLFDFFFYWAHRWGHEVNFFWGAHVVHHQSEEYNLTVALRQSWFHNLIAMVIFLLIPVLGVDPLIFFAASGINILYQFWIHTKVIGKMHPWIEYIFNTPSHHRVHHAVEPKYLDKNYGGMFIFWDRMFGTFVEEKEEPTYGITTPLRSWNPVWANVHYYVEMWEQMKRMSRWQDKLKMIFARPGWLPEELGGYQEPPEVEKSSYQKYRTQSPKLLNLYVIVQLGIVLLGLVAFMFYFEELSTFYQVSCFGVILLSSLICGAILENRPWGMLAEYARLVLVLLCLNTLYYFWYLDWFMVMLFASIVAFVMFNVWFTLARHYALSQSSNSPSSSAI